MFFCDLFKIYNIIFSNYSEREANSWIYQSKNYKWIKKVKANIEFLKSPKPRINVTKN